MQICSSCGGELSDQFRFCGFCGFPLETTALVKDSRKTVTVVFCDLKGSTNLGEVLDSESLRELMSRYFDRMSDILEGHGGTVEGCEIKCPFHGWKFDAEGATPTSPTPSA